MSGSGTAGCDSCICVNSAPVPGVLSSADEEEPWSSREMIQSSSSAEGREPGGKLANFDLGLGKWLEDGAVPSRKAGSDGLRCSGPRELLPISGVCLCGLEQPPSRSAKIPDAPMAIPIKQA